MTSAQDPLIHTLFSCNASFNVAPPPSRKANRPSGGEVPKNTEGLRTLAAEGSWIDLLDLAQNLERELIRANQQTTNDAILQQLAKQNYIDGAVLQLILTRVTAYAKMNDFGRAVQVLQGIPFDRIPEAEIPFSLSFLKLFLPILLSTSSPNQVAACQSGLYAMLAKVEAELAATKKIQLEDPETAKKYKNNHDPVALLEHRRFRVARALFIGHMRGQELVTATSLLQAIARFHAERKDRLLDFLSDSTAHQFSENIFTTSPVVSKASPEFSSSQKLSLKSSEHLIRLIETATMEQMLCLQQALSLSLYAGNAPLAHFLRKAIEMVSVHDFEQIVTERNSSKKQQQNKAVTSSDDDDLLSYTQRLNKKKSESLILKELIMCLNDSLLDVFFDRPADAASRLSNVVGTFLINSNVLPQEIRTAGKYGMKEDPNSLGAAAGAAGIALPFYLDPARSIHVQHQFLSICCTVIALAPHALHTPPTAASQRAPASAESKRSQTAPDTALLCNAALDRIATAVPHIALRMPGFQILVSEVRNAAMTDNGNSTRKQVYQSVLSYLVAGRESISNIC